VGVTVACERALPSRDKCQPNTGLFIPLPSVNSWYAQASNSHIITWEGGNYYSSNNGIPDDTQKATMCLLENNAHYDSKISINSCTCNTGYTKNADNKCADGTGVADPAKTPYGKQRDPEAEKRALQSLDNLFSDLKAPPTANMLYLNGSVASSTSKAREGDDYRNEALQFAADGRMDDATNYLNKAISSYDEALGVLGNDPPPDWKPSYECLVSSYDSLRNAAQTLLWGVPYFKVSTKAADYWYQAKAFIAKAQSDRDCVIAKMPSQ
jgi:hypothetical protein